MKMRFLENMNQRVKKFGIVDVKLAQGAAMFFALIVAKLIPQIMDFSIWWFIVLLVLCAAKPFCVFWFKI
jgi:hypothetical protein